MILIENLLMPNSRIEGSPQTLQDEAAIELFMKMGLIKGKGGRGVSITIIVYITQISSSLEPISLISS